MWIINKYLGIFFPWEKENWKTRESIIESQGTLTFMGHIEKRLTVKRVEKDDHKHRRTWRKLSSGSLGEFQEELDQ